MNIPLMVQLYKSPSRSSTRVETSRYERLARNNQVGLANMNLPLVTIKWI